MCDCKLTVAKLPFLLCLAKSLYAVLSSVAGICVTSPTTHRCTLATAALHSSMCPPWESLTAVKTWAERCRLSSGRCWSFWTRRRRRSTVSSTSIRLPAGAEPPFYPSPKAKKKMHLTTSSQTFFLRYIKKKKKVFTWTKCDIIWFWIFSGCLSLVLVLYGLLGLVLFHFLFFSQLWRRFKQRSQADPQ